MDAADDPDAPAADTSFPVVRHGFDRTAVRRRLAELTERAERAEADRLEAQTQVAELQGELEIARREIAALTERLDTVESPNGTDGGRLLELARSQAAEVTARAKVAAEETWAAAEQASTALRDRYRAVLAALDEQHKELNGAHLSIMRSAQKQAEELTTVAERRRRELDAEAERDRIRIDREFSESMNAKRKALQRDLESRRAACEHEVAERLHAADAEARRRVDSVTEHVRRLSAIRTHLTERLRETRELLEQSAALLEPAEPEHPDAGQPPDSPAPLTTTNGQATDGEVPPQRGKHTEAATS